MGQFSQLSEVQPARPAHDGHLEVSPTYMSRSVNPAPNLGVKTLYELFKRSCEVHSSRPCLGARPIVNGAALAYEFLTYAEAGALVASIATSYTQLGVVAKDRVAIFGVNCREWMIAMQAVSYINAVCVPLYETLGDNAVEYVLRHSASKLVVCAGPKLDTLLKSLPKVQETVHAVLYYGEAPEETLKAVQALGVKTLSWTEALTAASNVCPPVPPTPEDLCTIMYTSGTTGDPKGVMLTHAAVVATIAALKEFLDTYSFDGQTLDHNDSFISYLPLAHIFDRTAEEFMLYLGASIGYWQGDIKKLIDDIGAFKPTVFTGVPRVFERVAAGVQDMLRKRTPIARAVFQLAFMQKLFWMKRGYREHEASPAANFLALNKIKQRLGGRVRVILTGGAPMARVTEEFMRVCMCAPVLQGYGLTETCAASCIARPNMMSEVGAVGPPMPSVQLRLEAVPDMGYSPSGTVPRGEVCFRGPTLFSGYYMDPEQTAEVMDADGFFHSGDIGELIADGSLRIIDRKKNIFKLSQGEYIAAERVEGVYKACQLVEQIFVYGNSFEPCIVGVVVPNEEAAKRWAASQGLKADLPALCNNAAFRAEIMQGLAAAARAGQLKRGLEEVQAIYLDHELFSVENDLLTPTFKLKRAPLQKKYQSKLDALYADLKLANGNKA